MFRPGDEVVSLQPTKMLVKGEIYKIKATGQKRRLAGQALHFGHVSKARGRLWFASLSPIDGTPCFRKVVRDKAEKADEDFLKLLKGEITSE